MTVYFFRESVISRAGTGKSRNAVAAAAYINREKLKDYDTGKTWNYSNKPGLVERGITVPSKITNPPEPEKLWNLAEQAENRANSRTARSIILALPHELNENAQVELVERFTKELSETYKIAVNWAVHKAEGINSVNDHAHLILTTRQIVEEDGEIKLTKKIRELDKKETLEERKQKWLNHINHSLTLAGLETLDGFKDPDKTPRQYVKMQQFWGTIPQSYIHELDKIYDRHLNHLHLSSTSTKTSSINMTKKIKRIDYDIEL